MFQNPLPGVPAVESPFFDEIFQNAEIDEETLSVARQLRDNGFAVIDFPDDEFERIAESIKQSLHGRYDWEKWKATGYDAEESLRIQDAYVFNEEVRRIATNAKVIKLLSDVFQKQAFPFQTLNFPVGTQQHFHTDSVHFSSMPERFMCGVWTAFEDIDEDCGPLIYYPGSHKWPIYTNEHIGVPSDQHGEVMKGYGTLWRNLVEQYGVQPQYFTPKKGQALIWLSNLLHGGGRQTNKEKTRWSQVTHYYFDGCAYYTPMFSDPALGKIAFRQLTNICTGEIVKNVYCGTEVPPEVLASTSPERPSIIRRLRKAARPLKALIR